MFHCHPCIFPCVFLNLWSQEKTNPYRKTTDILFFRDFASFISLLTILSFFIKINDFLSKIGPIWAHKGPMGPYGPQPGPGPNPDWAPTRFFQSYHVLGLDDLDPALMQNAERNLHYLKSLEAK